MGVSHKLKLCFVHIPKTAGVSIGYALNLEEPMHRPCSYWKRKYPDYKIFTVIRGRRDRLISSFRYHEKNKDTIKSFEHSIVTQSLPLDHWIDEPCDYYLRFERLQEDFNAMLLEIGKPGVLLDKLNVSS